MNQNPEQKARDNIDRQLYASGWVVQNMSAIDLSANDGVAVRELKRGIILLSTKHSIYMHIYSWRGEDVHF